MPSLRELVAFAAFDTLSTAQRVDAMPLRPATRQHLLSEIQGLQAAQQNADPDPEEIFIRIDRIRRILTDEMISRDPDLDLNWHWLSNFSHRTSEHVHNIVMHPDYKPPKGHP